MWECVCGGFVMCGCFGNMCTCIYCVFFFVGHVVSMLASGTQVCGFKPGRSRWIFTGVKILSMPSSGGEVKESLPCPSFAACQRT